MLGSPQDTKPVGGLQPHYFRRLSLKIGAAYVFLVLSGFAAVGFGLRSSDSRSAPPVHIPPVRFPTTSPAQTVGASPGTTTSASAAPSVTSPVATPPATVSPVAVSPVAVSSEANAAQPTVSVAYVVVADYDGQFKGEVTVENNGSAPISGWQIVVQLPSYDQITSFWNASGYVSNDILLLQPASSADAVPAGGTLSVSFTAVGPQTTPEVCAFNSITCG